MTGVEEKNERFDDVVGALFQDSQAAEKSERPEPQTSGCARVSLARRTHRTGPRSGL